eukprot:Gregarina_sp_Pseudo_9__5366@NODE_648_length_2426_cov_14_896104_g611_i0_p1_GENE_NODE_648_length_2426_cov_14_896104_g611_i0NODE_648_length_2426_cov_14_896104_g611_i0_p1_ORF_typecomplete_len345_score22_40_NODE_648_length_2426_cov_14_896104_g611_i05441578
MKSEDEITSKGSTKARQRFATEHRCPNSLAQRVGALRQLLSDPLSGLESTESREVFDLIRDVVESTSNRRNDHRRSWRHVSWREQNGGYPRRYWTESGCRRASLESDESPDGYVPTRVEDPRSPVPGATSQLSLEAGTDTLFDLSSVGDMSVTQGMTSGLVTRFLETGRDTVALVPGLPVCSQHSDACFACELRDLQANMIDTIVNARHPPLAHLLSPTQQSDEGRHYRSLSINGRRLSRRSGSPVTFAELATFRRKSTDRRFSRQGAPDVTPPTRNHGSGDVGSEGDFSVPSLKRFVNRSTELKGRTHVTASEGALETDRSSCREPKAPSAFSCLAPKLCFFM